MKCKGCQDRYVGCHSVCEYYLEYAKERDEMRHKRMLDNQGRDARIIQTIKKQSEKYRRNRNG